MIRHISLSENLSRRVCTFLRHFIHDQRASPILPFLPINIISLYPPYERNGGIQSVSKGSSRSLIRPFTFLSCRSAIYRFLVHVAFSCSCERCLVIYKCTLPKLRFMVFRACIPDSFGNVLFNQILITSKSQFKVYHTSSS